MKNGCFLNYFENLKSEHLPHHICSCFSIIEIEIVINLKKIIEKIVEMAEKWLFQSTKI